MLLLAFGLLRTNYECRCRLSLPAILSILVEKMNKKRVFLFVLLLILLIFILIFGLILIVRLILIVGLILILLLCTDKCMKMNLYGHGNVRWDSDALHTRLLFFRFFFVVIVLLLVILLVVRLIFIYPNYVIICDLGLAAKMISVLLGRRLPLAIRCRRGLRFLHSTPLCVKYHSYLEPSKKTVWSRSVFTSCK